MTSTATTSSANLSQAAMSSSISKRGHKQYSSEDLQLLKQAHSSASSINTIVERNSLQSDLLTSLDSFIQSIETKLDNLESLFKSKEAVENAEEKDDNTASLQNLYDTLITIKNSAFTSNIDQLTNILDNHYEGLLSTINSDNLQFHEKLLTTLHFLDAKINQFNSLITTNTHIHVPESGFDSIKAFKIKFHSYEHAMTQGHTRLLHYYELPFPWRENQYIVQGYRFQSNHVHALQSTCSLHNETSNIWSHLIGMFIMLYISFVSYPASELYAQSSLTGKVMMYLYLTASVKCLISSSIWHTFNGTSSLYLRQKFACIDYTGITVLITAAIVSTEYCALFYYPTIRIGFISFSLLCGIGGFFFNWSAFFDRPESKPFRVAFYLSLSGLGFSAFSILAYHKGVSHALHYYSPIARSSIWYLIGVVFYATLVPERFRTDVIYDIDQPEQDEILSDKVYNNLELYFKEKPIEGEKGFMSLWWVDYVFASHNIWHIFVLLGILGHYNAIYEMFMNIPFNQ